MALRRVVQSQGDPDPLQIRPASGTPRGLALARYRCEDHKPYQYDQYKDDDHFPERDAGPPQGPSPRRGRPLPAGKTDGYGSHRASQATRNPAPNATRRGINK